MDIEKSLYPWGKYYLIMAFVVQSLSRVWLCIPWIATCHASLSFTISRSLLKLMSTETVMPSNHLILSRPLLLPPLVFPSIRVFSNESVLCIFTGGQSIGTSASTSVPPMNIQDWFLLGWISCCARTLKSLLQHHSSKASILWHSTSFMVLSFLSIKKDQNIM